ncbi:MAG: hypothetical protein AVDCRST_MAG20-588 [uncultured Acidimicrobiales bacterium]|uniref:Uncharacterized protein n=1 Tax=uncultured Acidimicrobiales bacterium TaxID=310071 RepID=A0A6J4HE55_9ACTN|nr:MAG: hypothetical protein AVDCRST_MAG20-588 [uncultured Acidimicrobiales bacterium]
MTLPVLGTPPAGGDAAAPEVRPDGRGAWTAR